MKYYDCPHFMMPGCSIQLVTRHVLLPEKTVQSSLTETRPTAKNRKLESMVNFQDVLAPCKFPPPSLGAGPLQATKQESVPTY